MINPEPVARHPRIPRQGLRPDLEVLTVELPSIEAPNIQSGYWNGSWRGHGECVDDLLDAVEDALLRSLGSEDTSSRRRRVENAIVLLQQAAACLDPQRRPPSLQSMSHEPWMDDRLELDLTIARQLRQELSTSGRSDGSSKADQTQLLMERLHKALVNRTRMSEPLLHACLGFVIHSLVEHRR